MGSKTFFGCKLHDQNLAKLSTKGRYLDALQHPKTISKDKGIHLSGITWKGGPESHFHYPSLSPLLLSGSLPCFSPSPASSPRKCGHQDNLSFTVTGTETERLASLVFTLSFFFSCLTFFFFSSLSLQVP